MHQLASRDEARAAKTRLASELAGLSDVKGLGLLPVGDQWAVRVNIRVETSAARRAIPDQVDGVPVFVQVVGEIVLHS